MITVRLCPPPCGTVAGTVFFSLTPDAAASLDTAVCAASTRPAAPFSIGIFESTAYSRSTE